MCSRYGSQLIELDSKCGSCTLIIANFKIIAIKNEWLATLAAATATEAII